MGPSISKKDFLALAYSAELPALVQKALQAQTLRRESDESTGKNRVFIEESRYALIKYRAYIKTIETIHAKYNDSIRAIFQESPESAAYILLAQSISFLKMAIDSLDDRHFEAATLLRPIDEAIALAEYFLIEKDSPQGKGNLAAWFHENRSPSNSVCRESIDKYTSSLSGGSDGPSMGLVMNRVYQAKSKLIHNAHHSIMETYKTQVTKEGLVGIGFDYGQSSDPRKLHELISFYQSSIWTLTQAMLICFSGLTKILSEQDLKTLYTLHSTFFKEMNERRS